MDPSSTMPASLPLKQNTASLSGWSPAPDSFASTSSLCCLKTSTTKKWLCTKIPLQSSGYYFTCTSMVFGTTPMVCFLRCKKFSKSLASPLGWSILGKFGFGIPIFMRMSIPNEYNGSSISWKQLHTFNSFFIIGKNKYISAQIRSHYFQNHVT